MESSKSNCVQPINVEGDGNDHQLLEQLKKSLPTEIWLINNLHMYLYQGFWCLYLDRIIAFQNHFQAQETDILLTSFRKTGTTWLKSLVYSICNRQNFFALSQSPLLTHNPHELVLQLESLVYAKSKCPDLSSCKSPRIFGSHVPFPSLPGSINESKCKIVYICRNPLDTFVSSWLFYLNLDANTSVTADMMGEYFDKFCEGKFPYGPYEDHVLQYWMASVKWPEKVLFLKYEDLKGDTKAHLNRLAEFVGCPFTEEEENGGVVDAIIELCSIRNLKEAVDKSGRVYKQVHNKFFFRKGDVGDWVNYLTPAMVQRLESITEEKFKGTGLTFKYSSTHR